VWHAAVIFISPTKMLHVDQGNHGLHLPPNTPQHMVGYFYFKSSPNIFFPNILTHSYNFSTPSPNFSIKPKTCLLCQSYFPKTITTTMSQSSNQNSPSNTSPNQT
jgi:hypothetical protein